MKFLLVGAHGKLRSRFIEIITRLMSMNFMATYNNRLPITPDLPVRIENYMSPFVAEMDSIFGGGDFARDPTRLLGVFHDIRGIARALRNASVYKDFIRVLLNKPESPESCRLWLFVSALRHFNDPEIVVPCLVCAAELVTNTSKRMRCVKDNAYGVLLFKVVLMILDAFLEMAPVNIPADKMYTLRWKVKHFRIFSCSL